MNTIDIKNNPIGFFDSGVGGLSVLKAALTLLPHENYIYFGDSKNAPYGIKSSAEIKELTFNAVDFLLTYNIKALVVACNTATSVAIKDLRNTYKHMPIIGIEPAVKPAVRLHNEGVILAMATPITLAEEKFANLSSEFNSAATIQPVPCPELVEFVENGILKGRELERYLLNKLKPYMNKGIACIVLGCTHFPFVKQTIAKIVGKDVPIIDGSYGTSNYLKHMLIEKDLLSLNDSHGWVEIFNSSEDSAALDLSYRLLEINRDRVQRRQINI